MSAEIACAFLRHMATVSNQDPLARFDTIALQGLKDITADDDTASCSCKLKVTPQHANRYNTLHGGCIATLVDVIGSAALLTLSDRGGVSVNINSNYLNALPIGRTALIEAKVAKLGGRIATVDVRISDSDSGQIVATGSHIKYIRPNEPPLLQLIKVRSHDPVFGSRREGEERGGSGAEPQQPRARL